MTLRILNLYAGIGGNRKLWTGNIEVTAIEIDSNIAKIYQDFFPNDKVIVTDAHQYLLEHFKEFDFIWSSPPCQSHSSFRRNIFVRFRGTKPKYPDLKLYEEIIFLQEHFEGKFVVENVVPYYKQLIPAQKLQRHLFWANFKINSIVKFERDKIRIAQIPDFQNKYEFNLSKYKLKNKRQILRNCVDPKLGLYIFNSAFIKFQNKLMDKKYEIQ